MRKKTFGRNALCILLIKLYYYFFLGTKRGQKAYWNVIMCRFLIIQRQPVLASNLQRTRRWANYPQLSFLLIIKGRWLTCIIYHIVFIWVSYNQNQRCHCSQSQRTQTIQRTNQNSKLLHVADANKARENERERVTIGFGFTSDWIKKVARVF